MILQLRWMIILANIPAGLGVYFYCRTVSASLPAPSTTALAVEQHWLLILLFLYIVNFVAALKFRNSVAVSATRMLFFGIIAFVVISHAIDICSDHRTLLSQVFGTEAATDQNALLIAEVRARLAAMASMTVLCLTCIAVGFESSQNPTATAS